MTQTSFLRSLLTATCIAGFLTACGDEGEKDTTKTTTEVETTDTSAPPEGSYTLSCSNAAVTNNTLTANCETLQGSIKATTLDNLSACEASINPDGDIGNIDGNLICIPALPLVDGFIFPKSDSTINRWITNNDINSQIRHGWGLWAGITDFVGSVDGQPVRAFQTWTTPDNMKYRITSGQSKNLVGDELIIRPSLQLALPNQATHGSIPKALNEAQPDTSILVSVAYNPPAAKHTIENKLLLESTLNRYLTEGRHKIPDFPDDAITIKPVYRLITASNTQNGIFTMPGWPGTPSPAKAFPESEWGACVYIDMTGATTNGNSIDTGCNNRNESNTFSLSDFIYDTLTAVSYTHLTLPTIA